MQALLGFELDFWDYVTFVALMILGAGFITALVLIAGLPGRIAIARILGVRPILSSGLWPQRLTLCG
jgi:hypothetical protein